MCRGGHQKLAGGVSHRDLHQTKIGTPEGCGTRLTYFATPAGVDERYGLGPVAYATEEAEGNRG